MKKKKKNVYFLKPLSLCQGGPPASYHGRKTTADPRSSATTKSKWWTITRYDDDCHNDLNHHRFPHRPPPPNFEHTPSLFSIVGAATTTHYWQQRINDIREKKEISWGNKRLGFWKRNKRWKLCGCGVGCLKLLQGEMEDTLFFFQSLTSCFIFNILAFKTINFRLFCCWEIHMILDEVISVFYFWDSWYLF